MTAAEKLEQLAKDHYEETGEKITEVEIHWIEVQLVNGRNGTVDRVRVKVDRAS